MEVKAQCCLLVCLVNLGMHRACAVLYAGCIMIGPALLDSQRDCVDASRSALFRAPVVMHLAQLQCAIQSSCHNASGSAAVCNKTGVLQILLHILDRVNSQISHD